MLCYAMLCYANAMLCYAMLCYTILYYTILYYTTLYQSPRFYLPFNDVADLTPIGNLEHLEAPGGIHMRNLLGWLRLGWLKIA